MTVKVRWVPDTLNLHQAKFIKGARILWELAIAFSPRLSEAAEKRIDEEERKGEFAVRGGRMYTEIIRIWDIVFQWNEVRAVCCEVRAVVLICLCVCVEWDEVREQCVCVFSGMR